MALLALLGAAVCVGVFIFVFMALGVYIQGGEEFFLRVFMEKDYDKSELDTIAKFSLLLGPIVGIGVYAFLWSMVATKRARRMR